MEDPQIEFGNLLSGRRRRRRRRRGRRKGRRRKKMKKILQTHLTERSDPGSCLLSSDTKEPCLDALSLCPAPLPLQ